jgi:hypothetical protein
MNHTNAKNYSTFTPSLPRKGVGYSGSKKKVEEDKLFIEGHHTELVRGNNFS